MVVELHHCTTDDVNTGCKSGKHRALIESNLKGIKDNKYAKKIVFFNNVFKRSLSDKLNRFLINDEQHLVIGNKFNKQKFEYKILTTKDQTQEFGGYKS